MTKAKQLALKVNTVIPLIKETGFEVVLNKPTDDSGTYVPGVGFTPVVDPDDVEPGYAVETEADLEALGGTLAQQVMKTLMCVEIEEPTPNVDTMTFKDKEYKVLYFEELSPGEVSFLYTVYLGV